jgi:hypothetical protein
MRSIRGVLLYTSPTASCSPVSVYLYDEANRTVVDSTQGNIIINGVNQVYPLTQDPNLRIYPQAPTVGTKTRYVVMTRLSLIQLSQVAVIDSLGRNVALNKSVTASSIDSTYTPPNGLGAGIITNGRLAAAYSQNDTVTSPNNSSTQGYITGEIYSSLSGSTTTTVTIDLGEEYYVVNVIVYPRLQTVNGSAKPVDMTGMTITLQDAYYNTNKSSGMTSFINVVNQALGTSQIANKGDAYCNSTYPGFTGNFAITTGNSPVCQQTCQVPAGSTATPVQKNNQCTFECPSSYRRSVTDPTKCIPVCPQGIEMPTPNDLYCVEDCTKSPADPDGISLINMPRNPGDVFDTTYQTNWNVKSSSYTNLPSGYTSYTEDSQNLTTPFCISAPPSAGYTTIARMWWWRRNRPSLGECCSFDAKMQRVGSSSGLFTKYSAWVNPSIISALPYGGDYLIDYLRWWDNSIAWGPGPIVGDWAAVRQPTDIDSLDVYGSNIYNMTNEPYKNPQRTNTPYTNYAKYIYQRLAARYPRGASITLPASYSLAQVPVLYGSGSKCPADLYDVSYTNSSGTCNPTINLSQTWLNPPTSATTTLSINTLQQNLNTSIATLTSDLANINTTSEFYNIINTLINDGTLNTNLTSVITNLNTMLTSCNKVYTDFGGSNTTIQTDAGTAVTVITTTLNTVNTYTTYANANNNTLLSNTNTVFNNNNTLITALTNLLTTLQSLTVTSMKGMYFVSGFNVFTIARGSLTVPQTLIQTFINTHNSFMTSNYSVAASLTEINKKLISIISNCAIFNDNIDTQSFYGTLIKSLDTYNITLATLKTQIPDILQNNCNTFKTKYTNCTTTVTTVDGNINMNTIQANVTNAKTTMTQIKTYIDNLITNRIIYTGNTYAVYLNT